MTQTEYERVKSSGSPFLYIRQSAEAILHIPCGWMIAERVPVGQPLIYGMRRSFFHDDSRSKSGYALQTNLLGSSGTALVRMQSVQELFSE